MSRPAIQFAHANGFPARSYLHLFDLMDDFQFHYVERMGHGQYSVSDGLEHLADELIEFMEDRHDGPVIGMGHSTGGVVILLAACRRPDLFSDIVILDPVLFGARKRWIYKLMKMTGLMERMGPARRARRRRRRFKDHDEAADYLRNRPLFMNWNPECFVDYIENGFRKTDDGVEIVFSPDVEAEIFRNVYTGVPEGLRSLKGTLIHGEHSGVFDGNDAGWWHRNIPGFKLIPFDGGHLFPFEQPEETAELLRSILDSS